MKKFIIILFAIAAIATKAQITSGSCTNAGFELGNFTNWTNPNYGGCFGGIPNVGFVAPHFTIKQKTEMDSCGGFLLAPQGKNYSARIGDGPKASIDGCASMSYYFTPSLNSTLFIFDYAVVVQVGTDHTIIEQPQFSVDVLKNGSPVSCYNFIVSGGPNIPQFQISANCFNTYYCTWTPMAIDLAAEIGNQIEIKFSVRDCRLGGHYCYAYISAECAYPLNGHIDTACVGDSVVLCAPKGFLNYTWKDHLGNIVGTKQCVKAAQSTVGDYTYTVEAIPYFSTNPSCASVFKDTLRVITCPLSVLNNEIDQGIKVYPNPASDYLNIETEFNLSKYYIYDMLGSVVQRGDFEDKINISMLSKGVYFLKVSDESSKLERIVKVIVSEK